MIHIISCLHCQEDLNTRGDAATCQEEYNEQKNQLFAAACSHSNYSMEQVQQAVAEYTAASEADEVEEEETPAAASSEQSDTPVMSMAFNVFDDTGAALPDAGSARKQRKRSSEAAGLSPSKAKRVEGLGLGQTSAHPGAGPDACPGFPFGQLRFVSFLLPRPTRPPCLDCCVSDSLSSSKVYSAYADAASVAHDVIRWLRLCAVSSGQGVRQTHAKA